MLHGAQIAVIVPAYNEGLLIERTLRSIPAFVDRVWVVDDGSTDQTATIADNVGDARVQVLRHASNLGVGAALSTGYQHALHAGVDAVAVMAGDAQMHPDDLLPLLAPVLAGAADYAKGDRLSHPEVRVRMPWSRRLGSGALSVLTRWATGLSVRDSQCGYTVLGRRALERIPLHALWRGYGYPNDMLGWLSLSGATICDVTVRPMYGQEQSGIRLRHAVLVIPLLLLRVAARRAARASSLPIALPSDVAGYAAEAGTFSGNAPALRGGASLPLLPDTRR